VRRGIVRIAAATAAEEGAPASLRVLAAQYAADLVYPPDGRAIQVDHRLTPDRPHADPMLTPGRPQF
jgi:hypothetical protein